MTTISNDRNFSISKENELVYYSAMLCDAINELNPIFYKNILLKIVIGEKKLNHIIFLKNKIEDNLIK